MFDDLDDIEPQFAYMQVDPDNPRYFVSNSELQAWKRCHRKWWLEWIRCLTPKITDLVDVRSSGTRIHIALAQWYRPDRDPDFHPIHALTEAIDDDRRKLIAEMQAINLPQEVIDGRVAEFNKTTSTERAMVEGYVPWLSEEGADENLRLMSTETPIMTYVGTVTVGSQNFDVFGIGILDARVIDLTDGLVVFIDHKTVGDFTRPIKTIHMNEQMLHYLLLEWLNSGKAEPNVNGAIYNMLRRVKRTAAAKPPFYQRWSVRHSRVELESYHLRMLAEVKDMLRAKQEMADDSVPHEIVYPSPRGECSWDCDFFSVCPLFDDGSHAEDMLTARYIKHDPLDRYRKVALPGLPPAVN